MLFVSYSRYGKIPLVRKRRQESALPGERGVPRSRNDNYAASVNYSCNAGDGLNGSTCTHTDYVPASVSYSYPAGSTLRLTTCESPAYAPATTSYNCNGLISNGSGLCTGAGVSANDQYAAWDACMAQGDSYGLSLNGVTLARSRYYNCVFQANTAYSCPNGGALSGNQCVSTSSQPATPSYSCGAGTLSGTQCAVPQSYAATPNYSCPNGGTVSGSTCLKTTDYAGTAAYSCPSGGTLNGGTCTQTSSYTATTNYSCPNGDPLSGSTCLKTTVYAGTAAYSCPSGGTLNGGTCTQTSSYTATTNYSCPSGDPLSGSTCLKTTVYTATASYSCPSGGSLNGTSCTVTSAYAATPNYSCTGADPLNGSTCTRTTTIAATPAYTCPNGATPLNGQCTGTSSTRTAYIYLGGKQIAETVIGGATQYVHTDALGSPVAHTNAVGAELNRTKFEPYGLTAAGTKPGAAMAGFATTGSAIGFSGHVNDPETDLVYMQQRYYDPVAGRFLSVDPVATDANAGRSFNRYTYAKNNPYIYVDPDGRRDIYIGGAADKDNTRNVQDYADAQKRSHPDRDIQYLSYSEKKRITQVINAPLKSGEPLNIIGHSLGGREAVSQANSTGAPITNLLTIDPVGSAGNGTKPSNVEAWTDVTAVPLSRNLSDVVASVGRILKGTTATSGADSSQYVPTNHGDFDGMMSIGGNQKKIDASY
jgi:RHS repeat-associated protein